MAAIIPAVAVGVAAGEQLPLMFNDAVNQLQVGGPNYLRDGLPESLAGKIGLAVGRGYCRSYAGVSDQYTGERAEKLERACRPYLDSLEPGNGATIAAPSSGGRCAVQYRVSYEFRKRVSSQFQCAAFGEWTAVVGANFLNPTGSRLGPITGPTETLFINPNNANAGTQSFDFTTGSGTARLNLEGSPTRGYWVPCGPSYEVRNVRFVRVDGLPDDCGPQPPIVVNPRPIADPTPPPFRFNPGPDIDIDIDIDISPTGDIIFDIGTGPITVDPFPDGGGGGGGGGGAGGPSDGPPGDIGSPGTPSDSGEGGESSGEAPAGSILVGIRLDVIGSPPGARQFAPGVFRGACYAYLGVPGNLDHDPAGAMLRTGQFVYAEKDNLTSWQVRANNGFNIRTTPYYREVPQ